MPTDAEGSTRIGHDTLGALFPMHVILDDSGVITHAGPTLQKIVERPLEGAPLLGIFQVKKPRGIDSFEKLKEAQGKKVILSYDAGELGCVEFRCLPTLIGEDGKELLIDFAFSADFVDLVSRLELSTRDFKPNDLSLDLIYTVETQRTLVEDSYKLAAALEDSKREAEHAANSDLLTGIANRRSLYQFLEKWAETKATSGPTVLLHIDLDKFKSINDSCGHAAGDAVLQHAADALTRFAGEAGFPARIGGDEFALVVPQPESQSDTALLANSIRHQILRPIEFDGQVFQVGASVGVVELDEYPDSPPDQLLFYSDIALYEAKRKGDPVVILTAEMLERHYQQAALIKEIEQGLKEDQFVPFFQPKIDTQSRTILGIEVLARWQHPSRGLVPPLAFLKAAETANLMGAIEHSIIKKAIATYRGWIEQGLQIGRLSINLTAANLHSRSFVQSIQAELENAGLSPNDIELELLESILFDRTESSSLIGRCQELRGAGFHLALDDFGTGYASISTLIDNTISTIKIDRSFIARIDQEERLQRITRSILALSEQLGLEVVAEGVETRAELATLRRFGCHTVQGYLFSRPADCDAMTSWLTEWFDMSSLTGLALRHRA